MYTERATLYLDILGWGKATETPEPAVGTVKAMRVLTDAWYGQLEYQEAEKTGYMNLAGLGRLKVNVTPALKTRHVAMVSDGIVLSDTPSNISSLISSAMYLWMNLLPYGFLIRGAVTCGLLHHDGAVVYGPALVRAAGIEKKTQMPRIIIDGGVQLNDRCEAYVCRDQDGTSIVHPFFTVMHQGHFMAVTPEMADAVKHVTSDGEPYPDLAALIDTKLGTLSRFRQCRERRKWLYMKRLYALLWRDVCRLS